MSGKDLAALAAANIRKPNPNRPPTILIYGKQKRGKTTFCATAPNVLILDPEQGTDFINDSASVWHISKWTDLEDVYQYLKLGDHEFEWVALDGMTKFANMALRYVMSVEEELSLNRKPGMVQQRDYLKAGELIKELMANFQKLDLGKIYTAQERQVGGPDEKQEEEDEDVEIAQIRYVADLPNAARGALNSTVDIIGRIYTVRKESTKTPNKMITVRRLWLGESPLYDTSGRSESGLPDMLVAPTVERLISLMKKKGNTNGSGAQV